MKRLILLLTVMALSACSPQYRLQRLLRNHPELAVMDTIVKPDTTYITGIRTDTTIYLHTTDSITLTKERLVVRVIRDVDTFRISGECRPDTVIKKKIVAVPVIFKQAPELSLWQKLKRDKWYFVAIAFFMTISIVATRRH